MVKKRTFFSNKDHHELFMRIVCKLLSLLFFSINCFLSSSPQTKAAFTRQYNKEIHLTPYATGAAGGRKRKARGAPMEEEVLGLEEETGEGDGLNPPSDEEEEEEGIETDTMIKVIPFFIYLERYEVYIYIYIYIYIYTCSQMFKYYFIILTICRLSVPE